MKNKEVFRIFYEIADLLEMKNRKFIKFEALPLKEQIQCVLAKLSNPEVDT